MVYLNTKADFFNYLYDHMTEAIETLQDILDDRYAWQVVGVLAKKEDGIDDETHMIQESDNDILQLELKEDEYAKLFRLGFTVEEAEEIIDNPIQALENYRQQNEVQA